MKKGKKDSFSISKEKPKYLIKELRLVLVYGLGNLKLREI